MVANLKKLSTDESAFLGLQKPWMIMASAMFLICGISVWLHNGETNIGLLEDIYNFSPVIAGAAFTIMLSQWNLGFTADWRWMMIMAILGALFWYSVPMGSMFH